MNGATDEAVETEAAQMVRRLFGPGINSTNRAEAFLAEAEHFEDWHQAETFWAVAQEVFSGCDDMWSQRERLIEALDAFSEFATPTDHLNGDNATFFAGLPKRFRVYRGCNQDRVMGLSWTTNRDVALAFARGHRGITVPDPVLASALVRKSAIYLALDDRNEREIVVNPRLLGDIRVKVLWPGDLPERHAAPA